MKFMTVILASALPLSSAFALAQGGWSGGGSSAGTVGGSIGSATGSSTLSNGNTINGTGSVPASNAQDAASRGHSGKAMGAINTLSNTNTGILAPDSSGRSSDKK